MSKRLVLYRVYGENDHLLYIGQTCQPGMRLRKHAESKDWWAGVTGITLQHFASRDEIERAERMAIMLEQPFLNVQHNLARGRPDEVVACTPYYDDCDPEDPFSEYYEADIDPGEQADYVIEEYEPGPSSTSEEERAYVETMERLFANGAFGRAS